LTWRSFISRNNTELLNAFGNFVNRTMTFVHRYFDGKVPAAGNREGIDADQLSACRETGRKVAEHLEACRFKAGLAEVMGLARAANVYFDAKQPWKQRKEDLAACGTTLNVCLQTVRALATYMGPFLPFSAAKCLEMLALDESAGAWDRACEGLPAGHELGEAQILFKKLDAAELLGEQ